MAKAYRQLDLDERRTLFRLMEAGRGDRRPARSASLDGLPRARAQPLPRRRPRLLRLLPPDRPRSGPPASAATWEAGSRRRPAGARGRAARGRLVAAADRRAAPARGGRGARRLPRDDLPPRPRPGGRAAAGIASTVTSRRRAAAGAGPATAAS